MSDNLPQYFDFYLFLAMTWGGAAAYGHRSHKKKSSKPPTASKPPATPKTPHSATIKPPPRQPLSPGSAASIASPTTPPTHESERVPVAEPDDAEDDSLLAVVGRLHPMIVHLPIGWLLLLLIVDLGTFVFRRPSWAPAGLRILIGTVMVTIPAMITGLLRHETHGPSDVESLIVLHRNLMFGMTAAVGLALTLRLWRRNQLQGAFRATYLTLVFVAVALMTVAAHVGGTVVFGEDYLPF